MKMGVIAGIGGSYHGLEGVMAELRILKSDDKERDYTLSTSMKEKRENLRDFWEKRNR